MITEEINSIDINNCDSPRICMEDGERRKTYCLFVSFLLWVIFSVISVKFSRVHIWLEEIIREEIIYKKREREKINEKKSVNLIFIVWLDMKFIFFSSPTSLSSHLLIFLQTKHTNSRRRTLCPFR